MVRYLDPRMSVHCESTLTSRLAVLFSDLNRELRAVMDPTMGSCFITTDIWSSRAKRPWSLWKSVADHRLFSITSDNASAMKCAGDMFSRPLNSHAAFAPVVWFGCVAHSLQLAIKYGIDQCPEIKKLLQKCKALALEFNNKHYLDQILLRVQERPSGRPEPLGVILPVETRWNSQYDMLERMVVLRQFFPRVVRYLTDEYDDAPSGRAYVTMANVIPVVEVLKRNFMRVNHDEAAASQPVLGAADQTRLEAFKKELANGLENKIKFRIEAMASTFFHPYHKKLGHLRYSRRMDVHRYIKELLKQLPEDEDDVEHVENDQDCHGYDSWVHGFEGSLLLLDPELADQSIDGELPDGDYDGEDEFRKYCSEHIVASSSQKTQSLLRDPLEWWRESSRTKKALLARVGKPVPTGITFAN
ncbi:hypothetical protein BGZ68_006587 [Mortierella alpina]|nr:hypothetical protein BGZ68_006587 [Mortierella alpina]